MKVPEALGARLTRFRHPPDGGHAGISAPVRCDHRTGNLTRRLRPGDIAVIDHVDLDRISAEALVECGVRAVVNTASSISGRYPNLGPQRIVDAAIPLVDGADPEIFARVLEGERLTLHGGTLMRGTAVLATGTLQTRETVRAAMEAARGGLPVQFEAFAANTVEYLRRERALLFGDAVAPAADTPMAGRHVLIAVRGYRYREDLAALRRYIREYRPVLIGVDGGADALLEAGHRPDLIVGDPGSVSERALACGAELVAHTRRDGRSSGPNRAAGPGPDAVSFPLAGTAEDAALLMADDSGAAVIVAAGTHTGLEEFVDRGRTDMAGTFLTRLRVGGKLVDAQAAARLHRSRISPGALLGLAAAALSAIGAAAFASPAGTVHAAFLATRWHAFSNWLTGLLT
ncbi:putative cytokinetic ring protein SteA [Streptomonospora sediminis]